jgi:hypothetical protein
LTKICTYEKNIPFFTSDVSGHFEIEIEIEIEGFSNTGVPISLRKNFIVNQLLIALLF